MFKHYIYKIVIGIKTFFVEKFVICKGQSNAYAILQTSHRIEKGITNSKPKEGWGKAKAVKLVDMISKEIDTKGDSFAVDTGIGVLKSYLMQKRNSDIEEDKKIADQIENRNEIVKEHIENSKVYGGTIDIKRSEIVFFASEKELVGKIFNSRHSVREFDKNNLKLEDINEAVQLALKCPSACNRQPFHIYAISGKKREKLGFENAFGASKYLIVTVDINAFTRAEFNDWILGGGIFTGYLVLALHCKGIGSCVMRKDLVFGSEYNDIIRKACNIPSNEKIVIELAIGYYKNTFKATYSNRKDPKSVIKYLD